MPAVGRPSTAQLARLLQPTTLPDHPPPCQKPLSLPAAVPCTWSTLPPRRIHASRPRTFPCRARRRVRYAEDDEGEEYGHNRDIAMIESYSAAARGKALLVRATVDGEEETVIVFRGFSSVLSSGTSSDMAKSVLPARAVIRSVDVVRGPLDPSNIEYLERGLSWEAFKSRMQPGTP